MIQKKEKKRKEKEEFQHNENSRMNDIKIFVRFMCYDVSI